MSQATDLSIFVRREGPLAQMNVAVEGVGCAGCIRKIENGLKQVPGIVDARINFTNRRLAVQWRAGEIDAGAVIDALERIGYHGHPFETANAEADETRHAKWLLRCLAVAGFAAMNIMLLSVSVWSGNASDITQETRDFFHWLSALIALPTAAYAGQPFFQSAWRALRVRQVNMDVPISLGVILALGLSLVETANHAQHAYFDSAVMLLFFLLCGRYFDHAMRQKTRAVAGNLAALKAEMAHRFDGSEVVVVPAAALRPGDRVLVRPGDRVPADGVVINGTSEIDESLVTGETARRSIAAGTTVYAGSVNFSGTLTLKVTAAGGATLIDEIERLLERAVEAKSRYVRLADRAARLYAPVVHTAAALTAAGWLVAGRLAARCDRRRHFGADHHLSLRARARDPRRSGGRVRRAVPCRSDHQLGRRHRTNSRIRSGDLRQDRHADDAGSLRAESRRCAGGRARMRGTPCLVEPPSARSGGRAGSAFKTPFDGAIEEPGRGVRALVDGTEARLGSVAFCGIDPAEIAAAPDPATSLIAFCHGDRHAVFAVSQTLRPDAIAVVRRLKALGLELAILSGDRAEAVAPVADALGIASLARRSEARREDRIHRTHEGGRAARADGRRRSQRCAGAGRGTCIDLADQRRAYHAGAGRRRLHGRAASAGARRHHHRAPRPPR